MTFPHVSIRSLSHASRSDSELPLGGCAGEVPTYLEALRWGDYYNQLRSTRPRCELHCRLGVASVLISGNFVDVTFDDGKRSTFRPRNFRGRFRISRTFSRQPGLRASLQGYVIWASILPGERIDDSTPFEGKLQRVGFPNGHMFAYLLPAFGGQVQSGSRELNWACFFLQWQRANSTSSSLIGADNSVVFRYHLVP
jgi:hypothetical protein